ncbi:MAG: transporter, partial [Rhodothermia bacterium]
MISTGAVSLVAQGIATDRPGFTASAIVVPRGAFQLESGVTLVSSSETGGGSVDQLILGEALIRFGLLERLEVRAELPNYNSLSFGDELDIPSVNGFGDSGLGVKYQIGPIDDRASFDLAVLGMISVPTGSEAFT